MDGNFTQRAEGKGGRPPKEIPAQLRQILDSTYDDGTDYVVDANANGPAMRELVLCGRLHAQRRGLSFRYQVTDEQPDGTAKVRFRLAAKRAYSKRDNAFWENK